MSANTALRALPDRGWRNGLDNLLRKELHRWWGPKVWWKNLLRWTLIVNGVYALISISLAQQPASEAPYELKVSLFFILSALSTGIGTIISNQSAILGELQMGTAAWVLSKPVSRMAFIISKFVGAVIGFFSMILTQAILGYFNVMYWTGRAPAVLSFAAGTGLWLLSLLFYLSAVLMLGTMLKSRGGVLGIPLAALLFGENLKNLSIFTYVGPFRLMDFATALTTGQPIPSGSQLAILTTALGVVIMMVVGIRRFDGQDL